MPLLKYQSGLPPEWCEMQYYEIVELLPGATHVFPRIRPKEKLIVGKGVCHISFNGEVVVAREGTNLDLMGVNGHFKIVETIEPTTLIRLCGRWGDELGGSGLFSVERSNLPQDKGDPVSYEKETNFDSHYHDCDEYWIIIEGRGIAVSEAKSYEVGPGDCIATGAGHHHDFPIAHEPVRAVYFETTLEGQKRRGHLWEYVHGPAQPKADRI